MQRIRSTILFFGLFTVAFLNIQAVAHIHKALAYPVDDNAVAVYLAAPGLKAPAIAIRTRNTDEIKTEQKVNVYLFYSYAEQKSNELALSTLIVIAVTFILYFSTYVFALIKSKFLGKPK